MGKARRPKVAKPAKPSVAYGYVHGDMNESHSFLTSLDLMKQYDALNAQVLQGRFEVRCGSLGLVAARNQIAASFLQSKHDWLLMIDADMGFAPDSLYRLLEVAHPVHRPIVGGLCFVARQFDEDGLNGYRVRPQPTLMDWRECDDGLKRFWSVPLYPVNSVVQVAATGSAFILIHRSVFEKIAENVGPTWYDQTHGTDGKLLGEDVSFCVRAWSHEIPVHVHTGVRTNHYKSFWLSEIDHWRWFNPPPAEDETAVIVPVLKRPQNAAPFMTSLRASTGLATVYAIADDDDPETIQAWRDAGAEVIVDNLRTYPRKVNLGYRKTTQPWLFVCGDDVKFHAGWLDHAQHVAKMLDGQVVGTNDLANPRVMAGEHATHFLLSRRYVDEVGASWDGPGVVCHEGYGHWWVDDELITAAKQRGVFQMALGSVVEHFHPVWGTAPDDEVYAKAQESAKADKALFDARLKANR